MTGVPAGSVTAPGAASGTAAPSLPGPTARRVAAIGVRFRETATGQTVTLYAVKALGLLSTEAQAVANKSHKTADWQSFPTADIARDTDARVSFYESNGYVLTVPPVVFALEPAESLALDLHAKGSALSPENRQRIGAAFDAARTAARKRT